MKSISVVAGILVNNENKILIARRHNKKSLPGQWEFPGGKIIEGESHKEALERELLEELNLKTVTKEYFMSTKHNYVDFNIELHAYISEFEIGEISLTDHDKVVWEKIENLNNYNFSAADIPIVNELILTRMPR